MKMNKSESIKNLSMSLSKFQAEISNPKNTANNPFFKSKYAPLNEILTEVRPLLTKFGLSVIQHPGGDGERITITTILLHESGEWIEFEPLTLKAVKADPQAAGSAITYGRRYSLSAVLGISSEDDDDGNIVSHVSQQNNQKPKQQNKSNESAKKCSGCGMKIEENVYNFSMNNHGKALCRSCQNTKGGK
jgi:hypothetical protein